MTASGIQVAAILRIATIAYFSGGNFSALSASSTCEFIPHSSGST
jgi:hypothetical protein